MSPNNRKLSILRILDELSSELGFTVHAEPQYGYVGHIEFTNGKRCFFRGTSFDVNGQGASNIAKDKDYTIQLLKREGISVPESTLVFSPEYRRKMLLTNPEVADTLPSFESCLSFIAEHEFPLFVKPNEGSEGYGVWKVQSHDECFDALFDLFREFPKVLVQRPVAGRDYRLVVLHDEVILAYMRTPFRIVGDGVSSIRILIDKGIECLQWESRGRRIQKVDPRIDRQLAHQGLELETLIERGRIVDLLPNANLSTGGGALDVTEAVPSEIKAVCVAATRALGLSFAGVDVLCEDITSATAEYSVLEINSAPGLKNFAYLGDDQSRAVKMVYRRLLQHIYHSS